MTDNSHNYVYENNIEIECLAAFDADNKSLFRKLEVTLVKYFYVYLSSNRCNQRPLI